MQIEEPFSILPLVKCHKWLLIEVRRMRSLVARPCAPEPTKVEVPPAASQQTHSEPVDWGTDRTDAIG